ncbi:MAG: hypothetical protein KatS3mg078_0705 [Deltaproteobacteria bacterium]|nr:MAG: hypothetical protein KatS3mg078_0705 [Deltaproteobacteria bacterium]
MRRVLLVILAVLFVSVNGVGAQEGELKKEGGMLLNNIVEVIKSNGFSDLKKYERPNFALLLRTFSPKTQLKENSYLGDSEKPRVILGGIPFVSLPVRRDEEEDFDLFSQESMFFFLYFSKKF